MQARNSYQDAIVRWSTVIMVLLGLALITFGLSISYSYASYEPGTLHSQSQSDRHLVESLEFLEMNIPGETYPEAATSVAPRQVESATHFAWIQFEEENTLLPSAANTSSLSGLDRADLIAERNNEIANATGDPMVTREGGRSGEGFQERRCAPENEVGYFRYDCNDIFYGALNGEGINEHRPTQATVNDVLDVSLPREQYTGKAPEAGSPDADDLLGAALDW